MARTATWLAIVAGSLFGALAALLGPRPEPATNPQLVAARSTGPNARPSVAPAASNTNSVMFATEPPASAASVPVVVDAGAPPTTAPEPASEAGAPPDVEEITSPKELKRAEIRCDDKDPEACMKAARAYLLGTAGVQNPMQAERFRRLARTSYVVQCDRGTPSACLAVVRMYASGDGVEQNPKLVEAFTARLRGLCKIRDAEACRSLP